GHAGRGGLGRREEYPAVAGGVRDRVRGLGHLFLRVPARAAGLAAVAAGVGPAVPAAGPLGGAGAGAGARVALADRRRPGGAVARGRGPPRATGPGARAGPGQRGADRRRGVLLGLAQPPGRRPAEPIPLGALRPGRGGRPGRLPARAAGEPPGARETL